MERRKGNIDTISGLPDEILHHILSFLPTNLSVRTSVLAKRWRFLWALVPNLEFHGDNKWNRWKKMKHLDIIKRVISLHEAKTLNSFRVSNVKGCSDRLEALIIYAVEHSVQNMYLDFGYEYGYWEAIPCGLPRLVFSCKTLVDLKLDNCGVIPSSGELFLPRLKKLDLSYVEYEDKKSLSHLLSGCPVLEELIVKEVFWEGRNHLDCIIVSSPTITTLDVQFSPSHKVCNDEILTIDVPALVYLKVYDCHLDYAKSLTKTMAYLIEAEINLNGHWHDCDINCSKCDRTIAFISSLCHVKYLNFSYHRPQKQIVDISRMPRFVNLTKLILDLIIGWHNLVIFLDASDNLEVLLFKAGSVPYTELKRVPTCMSSRLRTVSVTSFDYCNEGCFEMVRYILRNAQILERVEIYPHDNSSDEEKLDAQRRISLFERGSKSCQCQLTFNVRSRNVMC